jgi:uncharacterized membrane protein
LSNSDLPDPLDQAHNLIGAQYLLVVFVSAFNGKRVKLPIVGGLAEKQAKG